MLTDRKVQQKEQQEEETPPPPPTHNILDGRPMCDSIFSDTVHTFLRLYFCPAAAIDTENAQRHISNLKKHLCSSSCVHGGRESDVVMVTVRLEHL